MESRYLQNLSLKEGHVVCYGRPVVLKYDYFFSNKSSVDMSNTSEKNPHNNRDVNIT